MAKSNDPPADSRTRDSEYDRITENLLSFLRAYSCEVPFASNGTTNVHVGAIDKTEVTADVRLHIENGVEALTSAVRLMLNDPSLPSTDVIFLLSRSQIQFYSTQNPLWVWLSLNIFAQAGLPPPGWVWLYLLQAADDLVAGCKKGSAELAERAEYVSRAFQLHLESGRRECLREFAESLRTFQLALRVRNTMSRGAGLMKACEELARGRSIAEQQQKTFGEAENDAYRAYHEWFDPPDWGKILFRDKDFGLMERGNRLIVRLLPELPDDAFIKALIPYCSVKQLQSLSAAIKRKMNKLS